MAFKAALRELDSEEEYEAELAKCAGVTGFHRWFFLKALSESLGFRMRTFAVEANGSSIGVLPILLRRRGPISTANFLPVPHVGPVFRETASPLDVLKAADPFLLSQLTVVTKWAFAPGASITPEPLLHLNFQVETDETFFISAVRSPEEYLAAASRNLRREVRLGEARGMKIKPVDIYDVKDWFTEQVIAPYRRQGIVPDYGQAAIVQLIELLGKDPRMLWRALHDDSGQLQTITASIIGADRVWAWMIAGNRGNNPNPQTLAYWDVINWSISHGLACDLGGAPNEGIREFKLRIGATPETYLVAERVRPEMYRKLRSLHTRIVTHRANRGTQQVE